jgi:hypothetical protein
MTSTEAGEVESAMVCGKRARGDRVENERAGTGRRGMRGARASVVNKRAGTA